MKNGKNVIIDNTNIKAFEAKPYVVVAHELGLDIRFVRVSGDFQNTHGVPIEKVKLMKEQLEDLSVEKCLTASKPQRNKLT
jgi:hypothetical protein